MSCRASKDGIEEQEYGGEYCIRIAADQPHLACDGQGFLPRYVRKAGSEIRQSVLQADTSGATSV